MHFTFFRFTLRISNLAEAAGEMLGFSGRAEVALIAMLCFRSAQAFLMPIAPAAASVCVTKGHLRRVQPLYRSSRVPGVMMASRFTDEQVKAKEAAGPADPLLELDPSTKEGKVFKTVILKVQTHSCSFSLTKNSRGPGASVLPHDAPLVEVAKVCGEYRFF